MAAQTPAGVGTSSEPGHALGPPRGLQPALLHRQPFGLELDVEDLGQAPPELLQDHLLGQALGAAAPLGLLALGQQAGAGGLHHLPGDAGGPPAETQRGPRSGPLL